MINPNVLKCDSLRKRAPKMNFIKTWKLKKHLGNIYNKILSHFEEKHPEKDPELDSNITALKMFFTILFEVQHIFIMINLTYNSIIGNKRTIKC